MTLTRTHPCPIGCHRRLGGLVTRGAALTLSLGVLLSCGAVIVIVIALAGTTLTQIVGGEVFVYRK